MPTGDVPTGDVPTGEVPTGEVPTWPELIVLMAFGAGPDLGRETVRGTVHLRDAWELSDDIVLDGTDDFAVEQHPVLGRLAVDESRYRVLASGPRQRTETVDGRVTSIRTPDALWSIGPDGVATVTNLRYVDYVYSQAHDLLSRPQPSGWEGDDFTRPTGPPVATEFLGRAAWSVEIAPPPHKPYPLRMVIDAATGRVLSRRNDDFTTVTEWTSVEFGVELDDALFDWDGPVAPTRVEDDVDADWEREQAAARQWLATHGLDALVIPVVPELTVHERDQATGAFHATIGHGDGSLVRRPRSDDAWELVDGMHWPHTQRWSDDRWDWALATEAPLDAAGLDAFRLRLARST